MHANVSVENVFAGVDPPQLSLLTWLLETLIMLLN